MRLASGDHAGNMIRGAGVGCQVTTGSVAPSTLTEHSAFWWSPHTNASDTPSGDQVGDRPVVVRRTGLEPSAFITYIPGAAPPVRVNAIRAPSGDHAGSSSPGPADT